MNDLNVRESAPARGEAIEDARRDQLRDVLSCGVDAAIITRAQAERLAALATDRGTVVDEERLRFVTGFADIFVTLGVVLFLGAAGYLTTGLFGGLGGDAATAALAWLLAEFFSRRRRMALPSIVLLAFFAYWSFSAVAIALGNWQPWIGGYFIGLTIGDADPLIVAAAAAATVILTALHYWRFGVPITVAAGVAALLATVIALALTALPDAGRSMRNGLFVAAGLVSFGIAMRFDLSDPGRMTRRSDIAFWLHLLAAPLIVHPVLSTLVSDVVLGVTPGMAAAVLAVVLLLSLVALVTDRRAILVSGLVYAGVAVSSLVREIGIGSAAMPLALLTLGAFVLLLSGGWQPLRRLSMRLVPAGMRSRLPHPIAL